MALSPLRSKFLHHHNRSLSFPSKSSSSSRLDENTPRFEADSCSSLSSIESNVRGLKTLYTAIDDLLLSPHIQHHIIEKKNPSIDQVMDGYVRLLDASSTAKDLVSTTKQHVQELLSALRRKDAAGIRLYLDSTKRSKKAITKCIRSFKSRAILATLEASSELVKKLSEAEAVTFATLEALLAYLIGKQKGWGLVVAKLVQSKSNFSHGVNEFEKMEALLQEGGEGHEEVMNVAKEVDLSMRNLEEEIECLFRQLIRTRVLLLNILNH